MSEQELKVQEKHSAQTQGESTRVLHPSFANQPVGQLTFARLNDMVAVRT